MSGRDLCQLCRSVEQKDISSACLIGCFVQSLMRTFFFLWKSVDHYRKEFLFFIFLPFSYCAHEAVPDSQFCSRTPQQDSSRTGSLLTTPLRCSKQTYKGKATAWKVIPVPTANRGRASVADMYPSPLWSSRQVASHLSCCCFLWLRLGKEIYRWDCKCPLDTAIKFHFEMMHAKVSINPSQR